MYLWGFLKAWELQECNRENESKNDMAFTDLMVQRIMIHDGERTLKQKLSQLTKNGDKINALYSKIDEYHKEYVALQKKVKSIADHVDLLKK